jgi:DNA-binding beta-propeller fold protein YncE
MTAVGQYLWVVDRAGNIIEILDTVSNLSVGVVNLVGSHSQDPAPDLIGVAPDNSYVFTNLRGIHPLTGNNKEVNNAKGSTPGVMIIKVKDRGRSGEVVGLVPISNIKNGKETADTHGLAVRD